MPKAKSQEDCVMVGCKGTTYAERKVDLLHQLGYDYVNADMFSGLSEIQIDQKARSIMMK